MAIKLTLQPTERILFCGSKWWGDPDMPENMQYPTIEVTEDGETFDYPLTFICQINCDDIAPYDKENLLPHEGMLYFFAAIDKWIGYDSPTQNGTGEWPKGHFVVKYAKSINFETFQSSMMSPLQKRRWRLSSPSVLPTKNASNFWALRQTMKLLRNIPTC